MISLAFLLSSLPSWCYPFLLYLCLTDNINGLSFLPSLVWLIFPLFFFYWCNFTFLLACLTQPTDRAYSKRKMLPWLWLLPYSLQCCIDIWHSKQKWDRWKYKNWETNKHFTEVEENSDLTSGHNCSSLEAKI